MTSSMPLLLTGNFYAHNIKKKQNSNSIELSTTLKNSDKNNQSVAMHLKSC